MFEVKRIVHLISSKVSTVVFKEGKMTLNKRQRRLGKSMLGILGLVLLLTLLMVFGLTPAVLSAVQAVPLTQGTTFTVNSLDDPGDGVCNSTECTLREAINAANAQAGEDSIFFSKPGLIELSDTLTNTGSVIINGKHKITISGNHQFRVFHVEENATLTIQRLIVKDGHAHRSLGQSEYQGGGGIRNLGTLIIEESTLQDNSADYGGGIHNDWNGTVTITYCTISVNHATFDGGGIYNNRKGQVNIKGETTLSDNDADKSGGALFNWEEGAVSIISSTLSTNRANHGGAIANGQEGQVTIDDTKVWRNHAEWQGGGIVNWNTGRVTITNHSIIHGNEVTGTAEFPGTGWGGGIHNSDQGMVMINNSTLSENTSLFSGGGIQNSDNGTVTISGSEIFSNEARFGGGIHNKGNIGIQVDIENNDTIIAGSSTIYGNVALRDGGGVYNDGTLKIANSTIGGDADDDANTAAHGGGILNWYTGVLEISSSSTVAFNRADRTPWGNGGGIENGCDPGEERCGQVAIRNSTVSSNLATASGGGIANWEIGKITITNSTLANNRVIHPDDPDYSTSGGGIQNFDNGTVTIFDSEIFSNEARFGGGIHNKGNMGIQVDIENNDTIIDGTSTIYGNVATRDGGGIYNDGTLKIANSTIGGDANDDANTAAHGGGIVNWYTGVLEISSSTIAFNRADRLTWEGNGGGIENGCDPEEEERCGQVTIRNSTLSSNSATLRGGGIANWGIGRITIANSTLAKNIAPDGGSINNLSSVAVEITNSIIAYSPSGENCSGTITSHGYNLEFGVSCQLTATGDLTNTDPLLGPLQDNGGHTWTHALLTYTDSALNPAIDWGSCRYTVHDQRGYPRHQHIRQTPADDGCDIGAYEHERIPDGDNIPDAIEDGAPNSGDGNQDGILDSQQGNVTSLPNEVDQTYVTLAAPAATTLADVNSSADIDPLDPPTGLEFPIGILDFTVQGVGPDGVLTVTLFLTDTATFNTYYKYGRTPDDTTPHWYEFLFDSTTRTGAEISGTQVILHFSDGERGDDDLTANGVIAEPGGPALAPNLPPLTDADGPYTGDEGSPVAFDGGGSFDPDGDPLTFAWTFGDGGTETGATPTHTYAGDGTYDVCLTVTDPGGLSDTQCTTATINNVPPTVDTGPDMRSNEGDTVSLAPATFIDPGVLDIHVATIDWGDGTVGPGILSESNGSGTVSGSHAYADDGTYSVAVTVCDNDDGCGEDGFTVTVNNVAPTVSATGDAIEEGGTAAVSASFTDPGWLDTHEALIDWNDGTPAEAVTVTQGAGSGTLEASHVYGDNGTYTAIITVTDDDGGVGTAAAVVEVANLAPSVSLDTSSAVSFAGGSAFLGRQGIEQTHRSSATDPGSDDLTFAWSFGATSIYYNDGIGPDPFPSPGGVFPFSASDSAGVTFTGPGVYAIAIDVTDDDGGADSANLPKLVTGDGDCTKSQGFWKHQFSEKGKHQVDDATLEAYLDVVSFASTVFSEQVPASTIEEARDVMWAHGPSMRDKAEAQLLAAWLNFTHGSIGWDEMIDTDGDDIGDTPFHQVMWEVETTLLDAEATHKELRHAKDLAEAVNLHDKGNPACGD